MKTEPTFQATVYVGLREGYLGKMSSVDDAIQELRTYTDSVGCGISVTPTHFVYMDGNELGIAVGLINYPRFPKSPEALRMHALYIAKRLGKKFNQLRCSIVFPDETVLLESGVDY